MLPSLQEGRIAWSQGGLIASCEGPREESQSTDLMPVLESPRCGSHGATLLKSELFSLSTSICHSHQVAVCKEGGWGSMFGWK